MDADVTKAIESYIYYKENKWAFVIDCAYTLDEVNEKAPIKLLPDREYLQLYCKVWEYCPLLAIPKTRRMTFSWTTIALYVHELIFKQARAFAFVSKKEEDADEIVRRALFILDHIPEDKISRSLGLIPKYKYTYNYLEMLDTNSRIQGFPQGADQLRQFTFSGVFGDEVAFWDQAEEFYSATFPTIDGGGRMTLVSSVAPGFFKRLCYDAMDVKGDINIAEYAPDYKVPMQGVRMWHNPKNKFVVLEIHYTADPLKRDPSYKESIKSSVPLQQYLREYEIQWDTYSGHAVYANEFGDIHILHEEPKPSVGLPMLIAFDFGLTPAAIVAQHEMKTTIFFKEFQEVNMGAERFLPIVTAKLLMMFPTHSNFKKNWKCWVDPSGFNRNDNDERQTALTVAKYFNPIPGGITWESRRKSVADALTGLDRGVPTLQIYEKGCPMAVKGFRGGYHYPEKNVDIAPNQLRPVKNMSSHIQDCIQYICGGVKSIRAEQEGNAPPAPSYSRGMNEKSYRQ